MMREDPDLHDLPDPDGQACRAPDFDDVYRDHFPYVWRSLRRLGVPAADVEDLSHDVFVVVHRKLSQFDARRPLRPWLFGIAFRLASEDRRRAHRRLELTLPAVEQACGAPGADDLIETDERRRLVLECLQTLEVAQRAVLILLDIDGEAAADVASAMSIPLATVYSRVRARVVGVQLRRRFRIRAQSMSETETKGGPTESLRRTLSLQGSQGSHYRQRRACAMLAG